MERYLPLLAVAAALPTASDLPVWMQLTAVAGIVLLVPAAVIALAVKMRVRFRKRVRWGIFLWNFAGTGRIRFTSWAVHLGLVTWNVTHGKVTLNLPGPFFKEWDLDRGQSHKPTPGSTSLKVDWRLVPRGPATTEWPQGLPTERDDTGHVQQWAKAKFSGVWIYKRRKAGTIAGVEYFGSGTPHSGRDALGKAIRAELQAQHLIVEPDFEPHVVDGVPF